MSTNNDRPISRRAVLTSAAVGGLSAWMLTPTMAAAMSTAESAPTPATPAEKANADLVRSFISGWTKKTYDAGKEMPTYLSSPCLVRPIEDKPALTKPADVAQIFIDFMKDGSRVGRVDFHRVVTMGPLVVTRRSDVVFVPGKPNVIYEVAGIFLVKDGKIREWTDYYAA